MECPSSRTPVPPNPLPGARTGPWGRMTHRSDGVWAPCSYTQAKGGGAAVTCAAGGTPPSHSIGLMPPEHRRRGGGSSRKTTQQRTTPGSGTCRTTFLTAMGPTSRPSAHMPLPAPPAPPTPRPPARPVRQATVRRGRHAQPRPHQGRPEGGMQRVTLSLTPPPPSLGSVPNVCLPSRRSSQRCPIPLVVCAPVPLLHAGSGWEELGQVESGL